MSDPSQVAAPGDFEDENDEDRSSDSSSEQVSFEVKVAETVKQMSKDAEGHWVLPDDVPEELAFAARTERRRRDTQAALHRTQQEATLAKVEASTLKEKLSANVSVDLTTEQLEELEDLKITDPDAWREKVNQYEADAADALTKELADAGIGKDELLEIETRAAVLEDFLADNPGLVLNDEVFANDLPPRITGKLERGEVSFEDFLTECKDFLTTGKKIDTGKKVADEPNLSKAGGGSDVSEVAQELDIEESYKDTIF